LKARGCQRTDSTHVLARVRAVNRLECAGETLRAALNSLAVVAPDWLRAHSPQDWLGHYARRFDDARLPTSQEQRHAYARQVGADGHALLAAAYAPEAPDWLARVPAVETLRRVWLQQFYVAGGEVGWRTEAEGIPPSAIFISSPYDVEAHYAKKQTTSWVGYKVHLSEACEDDAPHLITHVQTTAAPVADGDTTPQIHQALHEKDLLPGRHLTDTGYLDAELLVKSREEYGVELVGPTRLDYRWQAKAAEGFAASDFQIDWEAQQATCPEGHTSTSWSPAVDRGHNEVIKIKFKAKDCGGCASRPRCTQGLRRSITVRPREQYEALEAARLREKSEEFKGEYAKRAGVEGTISQGVRACGLRRSRSVGQAKTHLQHVATAAALNVNRIASWLLDKPREQTRTSTFARLMGTPSPH
jgi:transposase